jgi:WD40 repeat protein
VSNIQPFEIEKFRTLTGHNGPVYAIALGNTPDTFYTSGNDGMIVEWKLDGTENGKMLAKVSHSVYTMLTIKETGHLIVGHNYEGIHIFDTKTKKETGSLQLTDSAIFDIKYHDKHLFVATGKGEIIVVDLENMNIINIIKLSPESVRSLEIVTGTLVAGYSDNYIRMLGLNDFRQRKAWEAHDNSVFTLKKDPFGVYLISGSRDAHLKVWMIGSDYSLVESIVAHMYTINSIEYNQAGSHFITGSMDKTIKLWDAHQFKLLKVIDKARFGGHISSVNKLVWSNYKNRVISCSDDRTISLWDIKIN